METRVRNIEIVECRLFILTLNTFGRAEDSVVAAVSDDYERLRNWYCAQLADEPYLDDQWWKVSKSGSLLEWLNPCNIELNALDRFGNGIHDEYVPEQSLESTRRDFRWI